MTIDARDSDARALIRAGGLSAVALALTYVVITGLYLVAGLVPTGGGQEWLAYLDGKEAAWWAIIGLSVLTDLLYVPVAAALVVTLQPVNRLVVLAGASLLVLFVVLDLAVTWSNYASLMTLTADHVAASTDAQRAAIVAAANYPASVLRSSLFAVYVIGVPAIGIGLLGLAMLPGALGRAAAYLALATGAVGVLAVVGPVVAAELATLAILAAVLTLVWFGVVGVRLLRLDRRAVTEPMLAPS